MTTRTRSHKGQWLPALADTLNTVGLGLFVFLMLLAMAGAGYAFALFAASI